MSNEMKRTSKLEQFAVNLETIVAEELEYRRELEIKLDTFISGVRDVCNEHEGDYAVSAAAVITELQTVLAKAREIT